MLSLQSFLFTLLNIEEDKEVSVHCQGTTYNISDIVYSTKEGISIICDKEEKSIYTLQKLVNTLHYFSLLKPINVKIDNKPYNIHAITYNNGKRLSLNVEEI